MKTETEQDIHGYFDGALSRRELLGRLTAAGAGGVALVGVATTTAAAAEGAAKPTVGELLKSNLNKQFYIAFMNANAGFQIMSPKTVPILVDHLLFLQDLEDRGVLFMAGPLRDGGNPSAWDGSGMAIIRAGSLTEAETTFASEPFANAGLRTNVLSGWQLNEGSFQSTIHFASGKYEIG